ncbi:hypothetical protein HanRHA438_Chr03g0107421 [Helianthus annuus]|nr:hypothetical protein HanRHA438_Chr03g0107421 [Helianthus annuus]
MLYFPSIATSPLLSSVCWKQRMLSRVPCVVSAIRDGVLLEGDGQMLYVTSGLLRLE